MNKGIQDSQDHLKRLDELPASCWYYREFIEHDWQIGMLKGEYNSYSKQRLENYFEKKLVDKYPNAKFREEEPLKGYRQWCLDNLAARYLSNLDTLDE